MIPRLLGGRYEITRLLRGGPVTDTYEAVDQQQGRNVVVEVLHTGLSNDLTSVALFTNRFDAAARLRHPGIVPTGRATVVREVHFAVRNAVDGPSLGEFLAEHGPPRPERAAHIAAMVGEALSYAHEQGVVHGGISPAIILLSAGNEVMVSGFGLAASLVAEVDARYVAPERAQDVEADARSDLYALGCCLYEMLVGRPPFKADTTVDLQQRHAQDEPAFPEDPDALIPAELIEVTRRLLAKQPEDRYQIAQELVNDLRQFLVTDRTEEPSSAAFVDGQPTPAVWQPEPDPKEFSAERPAPDHEGAEPAGAQLDPPVEGEPAGSVPGPRLSLPSVLEDLHVPTRIRGYEELADDPYEELVGRKSLNRTVALLAAAVLVPFAVGGLIATQWIGGGGSTDASEEAQAASLTKVDESTTTTARETSTTEPATTTTTKPPAETTTTTTTAPPEPSTTADTEPSTTRPSTTPPTTSVPRTSVPNVVGRNQGDAERTLRNAGFEPSARKRLTWERGERGRVTDQDPNAGQNRPAGSTVTITIGCGGRWDPC